MCLYLSVLISSLLLSFSVCKTVCACVVCNKLYFYCALWTWLISSSLYITPYTQHTYSGDPEKDTMTSSYKPEVDDVAESCRVGVRVPPFYPDKPALWFSQLDAQFALSKITTDETKYFYVTGFLDPKYADVVEDVITDPPATGKYEKLKSELVRRLSVTREEKVKQLLMHEELGDRKPSQFYRHLVNLAGPGVPEEFLWAIWTSRLPPYTQTIVASQSKMPMVDVADLADRILAITGTPAQVASTSAAAPASSSALSGLHVEIAALHKQMEAMALQIERLSRDRGRSRSRSRRRSSSRSHSNYRRSPHCWYHQKFGDRANKCVKPCDYPMSGNVRGNQ